MRSGRFSVTTATPSATSSSISAYDMRGPYARDRAGGKSDAEDGLEEREERHVVGHDAEIGGLEDRRLRVLVDGDDDAGTTEPDDVLVRPAHGERDVHARRDRASRETDLML